MEPITAALLAWYDRCARALPWRGFHDAYRTWVSEAMLQQTRVETVLSYYPRFLERFPSLPDLAAAPEADVLKAWEGLGYYSRARNLLKGARQVMEEYGGTLEIHNPPPHIRKVLRISGADRLAVIRNSVKKERLKPAPKKPEIPLLDDTPETEQTEKGTEPEHEYAQ